jgi:hypothetical protein
MLMVLRQCARRSKFSRRPERSCSVGTAKLVTHEWVSACSAVRRRDGPGLAGHASHMRVSQPSSAKHLGSAGEQLASLAGSLG